MLSKYSFKILIVYSFSALKSICVQYEYHQTFFYIFLSLKIVQLFPFLLSFLRFVIMSNYIILSNKMRN